MSVEIEQLTFDWDVLEPEVRTFVRERTVEIDVTLRRTAEDLIRVGQLLTEVKGTLDHGQFGAWRSDVLGMSASSANRLMQVYERFGQIPQIGDFDASALYVLAQDATPIEALAEALERAEGGEHITHAIAGEIVRSRLNDGMRSSKSDEWYTPPYIVQRVINMFGTIDLDPCSNSKESPSVPAQLHYTREDDGLAQAWNGYLFLNPPYGDAIGAWTAKLEQEYLDGNVALAIALVPARTDTAWFQPLFNYPICFLRGRLKFGNAGNPAPFPSAVIYFGDDIDSFVAEFGDLGRIVIPQSSGQGDQP